MAYDPTLPANNAPVVSAELRNQFAGLKELIDQKTTAAADVLLAIQQNSSGNSNGVATFDLSISDPPTQAEVQALADKFNELINTLRQAT